MTRAALYLAALLASVVARRRPSRAQTMLATSLCALFVIDASRPFLAAWLPLYVAGFVAWYAAQSWTVARVLDPSGPRVGQAFGLLACGAGVALQLEVTGELARACFALALASQLLAGLRFIARGVAPDDAQRVALILAASSLADAFGPWLAGHASKDWGVGHVPAVLTWLTIAGWEARCLMRVRSGPGTSSRCRSSSRS